MRKLYSIQQILETFLPPVPHSLVILLLKDFKDIPQFRFIHRLKQIIRDTVFVCLLRILEPFIPAEHYGLNFRPVLMKILEKSDSVPPNHHYICKYNIYLLCLQNPPCLDSIKRCIPDAEFLVHPGNGFTYHTLNGRLIFNNKNINHL